MNKLNNWAYGFVLNHEGSGSAGTYNTIKNKLSKSNVNTNGLALQGKTARTDKGKEETINWLKELGY